MKLIDKIMDALSLYEEEEILDEEVEVKAPAKQPVAKERPALFRQKTLAKTGAEPAAAGASGDKKTVLSFRNPDAKTKKGDGMSKHTLNLPVEDKLISVVVLEPVSFDDSQKIADFLRDGQPVVVNFAGTDHIVTKRMTDFVSGCIYAIGGTIKKLGRNVLVCAPKNVDIDAGGIAISEERSGKPWEK